MLWLLVMGANSTPCRVHNDYDGRSSPAGSRHIPGIRKAQEDVARITHVMVPQAKIAFSPLKSFATCTFARLAANYCPSVITPKIPLA
jgi:hypothetical protein